MASMNPYALKRYVPNSVSCDDHLAKFFCAALPEMLVPWNAICTEG